LGAIAGEYEDDTGTLRSTGRAAGDAWVQRVVQECLQFFGQFGARACRDGKTMRMMFAPQARAKTQIPQRGGRVIIVQHE